MRILKEKLLTNRQGIAYLLLTLICGLALWPDQEAASFLSAQSPLPTPTPTFPVPDITPAPRMGDYVLVAQNPPPPPTPTATRIPDDEPPATTLSVAGPQNEHGWYRTPLTLTFSAVDNRTGWGVTWYRFNNDPDWSRYEHWYYPVELKGEGEWLVQFYSEDRNHNPEPVQTAALNIDLTPPTVTHTLAGGQSPEGRFTPPVTVTLGEEDQLSGLDFYRVNLNGRGWLAVTTTYVVTTAGSHILSYQAVDRAGNVSPVVTTTFVSGEVKGNYLPLILK